jgi:DNA-binding XRE family transcriptional regulator
MNGVQVIKQGGKPAFYVVPAALWKKISNAVKNADDVAAFDRAMAGDDGLRLPESVTGAMGDRMHAVRAWREYRGMTQDALATAAHISKPFISQIESGKRGGSMRTLKKLAAVLGVGVDVLI